MNTIIQLVIPFLMALTVGLLVMPMIRKWSIKFGFTDKPGERKVHFKPIPVVGGIGIFLSVGLAVMASTQLRHFVATHIVLAVCGLLLTLVGIVDDKVNLPAKIRLLLQVGCAFVVAQSGIRLQSLYGIAGIYELAMPIQYVLTVLVITGITNAFNLIDGIDGLAGMLALVNTLVLGVLAACMNQYNLVLMLLAIAGGIAAFLKYNLYPAKIFMGDGGSLFLGFTMSVTGIYLTNTDHTNTQISSWAIIIVTACFIIPVVDTLRVFIQRIRRGKSPFVGDKTHLHHKLIRHFLVHGSACKKLVAIHLSILLLSIVAHLWLNTFVIICMQAFTVLFYTLFLDFSHNYSRWYRFIKRHESAN